MECNKEGKAINGDLYIIDGLCVCVFVCGSVAKNVGSVFLGLAP